MPEQKIKNLSPATIIIVILLILVALFIFYRFVTSAKKPDIIVNSPAVVQNGDVKEITVHTNKIELSGYVSDIVDFRANGQPIFIDEQGNYSVEIPLQEGSNFITFVAKDKFGRETIEKMNIVYVPKNGSTDQIQNDNENN